MKTKKKFEVRVRPASLADIPSIIAAEREAPEAAHWSQTAYRSAFESDTPRRIRLVAVAGGRKDEGAVLGFLLARMSGEECEVENLIVRAECRRRGIGSQLMGSLITEARKLGGREILLEARESNRAARGLYETSGFAVSGQRRAYYGSPREDAILYGFLL